MHFGYCRVSTIDQNADLQLKALQRVGCEKIFKDQGLSGRTVQRPSLLRCLKALQEGDKLTVWRLDRLARSLRDLVNMLHDFHQRGIQFCSLNEQIDTSTPSGKLIFHIFAALAEFEAALIRERSQAGVKAARMRGVQFGRKPKLSRQQIQHARKLVAQGEHCESVADLFKVSRVTLWRALAKAILAAVVLVRREMQSWRAPLANITPFLLGQFAQANAVVAGDS
jgi:DNA invertase Pin-like site-specific DNA recombinase